MHHSSHDVLYTGSPAAECSIPPSPARPHHGSCHRPKNVDSFAGSAAPCSEAPRDEVHACICLGHDHDTLAALYSERPALPPSQELRGANLLSRAHQKCFDSGIAYALCSLQAPIQPQPPQCSAIRRHPERCSCSANTSPTMRKQEPCSEHASYRQLMQIRCGPSHRFAFFCSHSGFSLPPLPADAHIPDTHEICCGPPRFRICTHHSHPLKPGTPCMQQLFRSEIRPGFALRICSPALHPRIPLPVPMPI